MPASGVLDAVGEGVDVGVAETDGFAAGVTAGVGSAPRITSPGTSRYPTPRVIADRALDVIVKL